MGGSYHSQTLKQCFSFGLHLLCKFFRVHILKIKSFGGPSFGSHFVMPNNKAKAKAKPQKSKIKTKKVSQRPNESIGQTIGKNIGGFVEGAARKLFKNITGIGDYKIQTNSLLHGNSPPMFNNFGQRAVVIRHREYIADISSSTNFTTTVYPINPGLAGSFPWLSSVADSYSEYKFHGLVYEFKSTSSDALNSTNTALGTVILATQYDSIQPAFANKVVMENYEYTTSTKPSLSMLHPVECARLENPLAELYVRTTSEANADVRFTDLGQLTVATVGSQASAVIGELWCTYEVELLKPKLSPYPLGSRLYTATGVSTSNYFGTSSVLLSSSLPLTVTATSTALTVSGVTPGAVFLLYYIAKGTTASNVHITFTITNASGYANVDGAGQDNNLDINADQSSATLGHLQMFTALSTGFTVTLSGGTFPSGTVTATFGFLSIA